jgi:hypothetical protein
MLMLLDQTSMHGLLLRAVIGLISLLQTASPTAVTHLNLLQPQQFQNSMRPTIPLQQALQLPTLMVFVPQQAALQLSQLKRGAIRISKLLTLNTVAMLIQLITTFAIHTLK